MDQINTCQVCGREIKATTGVIAHHGYKRPQGWGWQTASCMGARHLPYEESCEVLKQAVVEVERYVAANEKVLAEFIAEPPTTMWIEKPWRGDKQPREVARPEDFDSANFNATIPDTYGNAYGKAKHELERNIRAAEGQLVTMRKRLAAWVAPQATEPEPVVEAEPVAVEAAPVELSINEKKRLVAHKLLQAAGNLVEFWGEMGAEGVGADEAAELLSKWLKYLPGDEWDTRLPQPGK